MPSKRYDILHVVWCGDIGGTERHVAALARNGRETGKYDHYVCFLDGEGPIGDELTAEGIACRFGARSGTDARALLALTRFIRHSRPRLIHFHSRTIPATLLSFPAAPGAVRVYTEHAPGSLNGDWRFGLFYRLFRRRMRRFVAAAPAMARCLEQHHIDPGRIVVIPHGLTIPARAPEALRSEPPYTVGVVGRLVPEKRLDVFLDVIAELDCRACIVGGGPSRAALLRKAESLGLSDAVEFAGSQPDVAQWLDRFDLFLMTSEVETFGIAALEAMARGVPVVAMPCAGGLAELADRGGRLLHSRDAGSCAASVASLLHSPDERSKLRERGARVAAEHTFETVIARHEALYSELL